MGRFVVGGLNFIYGGQKLYSVTYEKEKELNVKTLPVPDMKCANSICFTTDGKFMYHADTPTHKIQIFPYKEDGSLGKPWVVHNYLDQPKPNFVTSSRRFISALSNFLPQYSVFFSIFLLLLIIAISSVLYFRLLSIRTIGLLFLSLIFGAILSLPIQDCPDGSIIDSKDQIWNAVYWGKRVCLYQKNKNDQQYTPLCDEGFRHDLIQTVNLPVSCATCVCLGGPDMNWLFITTGAFVGEPQSGGLYVTKVATKGVVESRFNDMT